MAGVSAFARAFEVQPNTVRRWTAEFADYLSADACPRPGQNRRFSEDDGRVMALVGLMRAERKPFAEIHAALLAGERADFMETLRRNGEEEEAPSRAITTQLLAAVAQFEGELKAVRSERDRLVEERDRAQAATLAAEIRAAKLEAQLEERAEAVRRTKVAPAPTPKTAATEVSAYPDAAAETTITPSAQTGAGDGAPPAGGAQPAAQAAGKTKRGFLSRAWAAWVYLIERDVPD
jgi:DNA-binding transcriptional MerR regulator